MPKTIYDRMIEANEDLAAKVFWLIDRYVMTEDGVFTFPDGDSWDLRQYPYRTKHFEEDKDAESER